MTLNGENILVLGLGVSGFAAAETALGHGACVTVLDVADSPTLRERAETLTSRGGNVRLEWNEDRWDEPVDLMIISPGIAPDSLLGTIASSASCPVISELEFGFRFCSCPIIAVTGTNGKTTAVELLVHCLRHLGKQVAPAGNIGKPLSEAARRSAALDFLVVEVSSFQLERVERFAPLAAAVLNITPDHFDRHGTFEEYRRVKLNLLNNLTHARQIVMRQDLYATPAVEKRLPKDGSAPLTFSATDTDNARYILAPDGNLARKDTDGTLTPLMAAGDLKLLGLHSVENVLAVLALADAVGIPAETAAAHARTFAPNPHRLELVAYHSGVRYINDSKATNVDALRQALLTVTGTPPKRHVRLIAGGVDKGLRFDELAPLLEKTVSEAFLIGRSRDRLAKQWGHVVSCKVFASLAAAFESAADSACEGDVVLLSPGCASQDMFENYAQRGDAFCSLVKRRIGE